MSFISCPTAIRFAPAWASLPSAAAVPVGTVYRVTGFGAMGFSFWVSDGTVWRPFNGFVRAFAGMSSNTAVPLATVVAALTKFVLPAGDLLFPANMLQADFMIEARLWANRSTTGVSSDFRIAINNSNNLSNGTFLGTTVTGTSADIRMIGAITFDGNMARGLRDGSFTAWNASTVATSISTLATDLDLTQDTYVSLGSGAFVGAADTLRLFGYELIVRG